MSAAVPPPNDTKAQPNPDKAAPNLDPRVAQRAHYVGLLGDLLGIGMRRIRRVAPDAPPDDDVLLPADPDAAYARLAKSVRLADKLAEPPPGLIAVPERRDGEDAAKPPPQTAE